LTHAQFTSTAAMYAPSLQRPLKLPYSPLTELRGHRPRWVEYLTTDLGFRPDDPLFPATRSGFDAAGIPVTPMLSRDGWSTADPIRAIFRNAFANAGHVGDETAPCRSLSGF